MREPASLGRATPAIVVAAAVVVVVAGIAFVGPFLAPFLFTLLATIVCRPAHLALVRLGWPGWLAMLVVAGTYALVVASLGVVLVLSLVSLAADLPAYLAAAPPVPPAIEDALASLAEGLAIGQADLVGWLLELARVALEAVVFLGFSALVLAYLLLDADRLRGRVAGGLPSGSPVLPVYHRLAGDLVSYVKVRAILGGAAAIADVVLLLVIGVPSPLLWGVVSFLFSFVPNVGFVIALIPPTVLAFLGGGLGPAIAVVVGYTAINLLFDYILQPRVMGTALDLSAAVIVLSIFAWTWLIGPLGAILAVPLTMVVRAVLREVPSARWLAALVGPVGAADGAPRPVGEVAVPRPDGSVPATEP